MTLPAEVLTSLQELMKAFDLRFGVIDMALTPNGEYVFLEVNPTGQWQWLEKYTELPITIAVAEALINDLAASEPHTASAQFARWP
jgi:glutathione synthase/RimK-type ligase-like ATP-grasp enzyme